MIRAFGPHRPVLSLSEVAAGRRPGPADRPPDPAHPGGARLCPRRARPASALTPRVLELGWPTCSPSGSGTSPGRTSSGWSRRTDESSSIAQLDGSDIVYVARVAVPKIIALRVDIGTRFPAPPTSLGKVLLAGLPRPELDEVLAAAVAAPGVPPGTQPDRAELDAAAARRAGQGLGAHRRAAGARDPLGGGAAAGRRRPGLRRDERHRARGRDLGGHADRATTCHCCCRPRARSAPTSPAARRCRWPRRPVDTRWWPLTMVLGHRPDDGRGARWSRSSRATRRRASWDRTGRPEGPRGPLSGLLVADFSRILAGPYASMLLADLGAEVVKVESPSGDDTRTWMPPVRDGVSTYYLAINRNKRSIALDLTDEQRRRRWPGSWPRRADILLENFRPAGWPASAWTTTRSPPPTRASSTPRSPASAPAAGPRCPATT